mmetsp:Transcript_1655/g.2592  ORF Transcript_1655/g.2592 Transcript_1655/m.2592 type:complete len:3218 (+) Transcript_1655:318-9971(+)|eukprot:CAMPEP_0203756614 /NCGR_PEP_ID=MMETSP0098-20131031/9858_1 /ASSEMBLY_ACC=CAM_ASM_000208 /TAXON_ID=96639 /ORGANISM=" , Strain NY0313808BC1" /LENGTH=3217 /DNA_ID=CAMNT_0050648555 /DNA_START=545 /DNA_END=10198 /DNA_ORIENTATION=-
MSETVLFEQLREEIISHQRQHEEDNDGSNGERPDDSLTDRSENCKKIVVKVKQIIASIVNYILVPSTLHAYINSDGGQLLRPALELMHLLLQGEFCPHWKAVFGYGEIDSVAPLLLNVIEQMSEPGTVPTGIFDLLVRNAEAFFGLIARCNLKSLCDVFDDLVDFFVATSNSAPGKTVGCFLRLSGTIQDSKTLNLVCSVHLQSLAGILCGVFVRRYLLVVGSRPMFWRLQTRVLEEFQQIKGKNVVSESRIKLVKVILESRAGLGIDNGGRKHLKSTLLALVYRCIINSQETHCWEALSEAIRCAFRLSGESIDSDPEDISTIVSCLEKVNANCPAVILKTLLAVFEKQLEVKPKLARHLNLLLSPHVIMHRVLHASVARCFVTGFQYVSGEATTQEELLSRVVTMAEVECKLDPEMALSTITTSQITRAKRNIDGTFNRMPPMKILAEQVVVEGLVKVCKNAMTVASYQGLKADFLQAYVSILSQFLSHILGAIPLSHTGFGTLISSISTWVLDNISRATEWTLDIAVDIGLAFAFLLRSQEERTVDQLQSVQTLKECVVAVCSILRAYESEHVQQAPRGTIPPEQEISLASLDDVEGVQVSVTGLAIAYELCLIERLITLTSNFPVSWFYECVVQTKNIEIDVSMEQALEICSKVMKRWLESSQERFIQARVVLQMCTFLETLRIPSTQLEAYFLCLETTSSRKRDFGRAHILHVFVEKLGLYFAEGTKVDKLVATAAIHSVGRINRLRVCQPKPRYDSSESVFTCSCHTSEPHTVVLGDLEKSMLLWRPWMKNIVSGVLSLSGSVESSVRVFAVKCCIDLFRQVAHVGACTGEPTILLTDSDKAYGNWLKQLLNLLRDRDPLVRNSVADGISIFVEGCGGGIEWTQFKLARTVVEEEDVFYHSFEVCNLDDNVQGTGDILRSMFGDESLSENVSLFMKTLRGLVERNKQKLDTRLGLKPGSFNVFQTLLHAIGSIGCTADIRYCVGGINVGSNLLNWCLLMLTQQYGIAIAWTNQILADLRMDDLSTDAKRKLNGELQEADALKVIVNEELFRVARAHGFTIPEGSTHKSLCVQQLFTRLKGEVYPQMFKTLFTQQLARGAPSALEDIFFNVLGYEHSVERNTTPKPIYFQRLLLGTLPYVLPTLVRQLNVKVMAEVAKRIYFDIQQDEKTLVCRLIMDNSKHWITSMLELLIEEGGNSNGGSLRICESLKNLIKYTNCSFEDLMELHTKDILKQAVSRLVDFDGTPNTLTEATLEMLQQYTKSNKENGKEEAGFCVLVRDHFMYIIGILSERIQNKLAPIPVRCLAFKCIARIVELVKDVDIFLPKVLATLKPWLASADDVSIQLSACETMEILVKQLSPAELKRNINSLIISIVPCIGSSSAQNTVNLEGIAVRIIKWVILEHKETLSEDFAVIRELLPTSDPALSEVVALLGQPLSLFERLSKLVELIEHEVNTINYNALIELRNLINTSAVEIYAALMDQSDTKPCRHECVDVMSRVIKALLRVSRRFAVALVDTSNMTPAQQEIHQGIRLVCSECLGEIGAIDPSYLNLESLEHGSHSAIGMNSTQVRGESPIDLDNNRLAAHIIERYLVVLLRGAADPGSYNQVGMAVQDLLRYFASRGFSMNQLREILGEEVSEVVQPFSNTNYTFSEKWSPPKPNGRRSSCFFGPEVSFETSVGEWFAYLASFTNGDQSKIFQALLVLYEYNGALELLLYLLPYVIQNVLCLQDNGESIVSKIRSEIIEVLRETWDNSRSSTHHSNIENSSRIQKTAYSFFAILDTLSSWEKQMHINHENTKSKMSGHSSGSVKPVDHAPKEYEFTYKGNFIDKSPIKVLLQEVPARWLAEAAYQCGDFPRALKYFEMHVRSLHSYEEGGGGISFGSWKGEDQPQLERDEITFLHTIYASLEDEPDGLTGVTMLRSRHDGGPGTGYILGRTKRTVSTWKKQVNVDGNVVLMNPVRREWDSRIPYMNPALVRPPGTRPGDGGQPNLVERIHELEHSGKWDEAMSGYEHLLNGLGTLQVSSPGTPPPKKKQKASIEKSETLDEEGGFVYHTESAQKAQVMARGGQLNCLRKMRHLDLVVSLVRGIISSTHDVGLKTLLDSYQKEALWRLGQWDELEATIGKDSKHQLYGTTATAMRLGPSKMGHVYSDSLARAMLLLGKHSRQDEATLKVQFTSYINRARLHVMDLLSARTESYIAAYPLLIRLHLLTELCTGFEVVNISNRHRARKILGAALPSPTLGGDSVSCLVASKECIQKKLRDSCWEQRFRVTTPSVSMREELFEVRRTVYNLAGLHGDEMNGWLSMAKTSRVAGYPTNCLSALRRVEDCAAEVFASIERSGVNATGFENGSSGNKAVLLASGKEEAEVALCRAKVYLAELYQQKVQQGTGLHNTRVNGSHEALMILEPTEMYREDLERLVKTDMPQRLRDARAKALLLATNLITESGERAGPEIDLRYKTVNKLRPQWGKAHFHQARFYENLTNTIIEAEEQEDKATLSSRQAGSAVRSGKLPESSERESQVLLREVVRSYGRALLYGGVDHIHESLPRMLTLWFTNAEKYYPKIQALRNASGGSGVASPATAKRRTGRSVLLAATSSSTPKKGRELKPTAMENAYKRINQKMNRICEDLPPHIWYTSISQLVSRICVACPMVWEITKKILARVLEAFPEQAFWHVMGMCKSEVTLRRQRANEILKLLMRRCKDKKRTRRGAGGLSTTMETHKTSCEYIFDALIGVAVFKKNGRKTFSGAVLPVKVLQLDEIASARGLQKYLGNCSICLPTQEAFSTIDISDTQAKDKDGDVSFINSALPLISGIEDRIEVLLSKARPKKLMFKLHDGRRALFLCKTEDRGDLRKDSRMMEFNNVINRLFLRDPHARKRKLRLRTYAVTCLNESCGLMEWVGNTTAFRHIVQHIYAEEGVATQREFKAMLSKARRMLDTLQSRQRRDGRADPKNPGELKDRIQTYRDKIRSEFPPILHKWFSNRFADPSNWLNAQSIFTRSAAVWSIVGHIIGLGDRHLENILMDINTAECVHVDFDCLFDKGLCLGVPEVVPFRLTPHMVDGMGLCGVDGVFRQTCEVTLQVLRSNKQMLMGVLESFVADPLVEWTVIKQKDARGKEIVVDRDKRKHKNIDVGSETGKHILGNIERRLDGIVKRREKKRSDSEAPYAFQVGEIFDLLPLSVQGQVNRLITNAIDDGNLCSMYSGWSPFI